MNYDDIKDMTNEEAAAYYGSITNTPIPCGDLENLLNWGGYASRNSVTGAWEGTLVDLMLLNAAPELSQGLDELFTHLNQPRSTVIDTTGQPWAGKMDDLLGGLLAAGIIGEDLIGEVIALGGGQPNLGTDYQAIRDAHAADELALANSEKYNTLYNEHLSPVIEGNDDAAIVAALQAMASNWSN
jgi:hypothetical protein